MESPITPQQITEQVLASFETTPDARRRELMKAFVSHLHAFVNDVALTEEEGPGDGAPPGSERGVSLDTLGVVLAVCQRRPVGGMELRCSGRSRG